MTTDFLCKVHSELCEEYKDLSQCEFSKDYLQMCDSYLAHLKCADVQPSANVLVKLWANLRRKEELYRDMAERNKLIDRTGYHASKAELFEDLADETERHFKTAIFDA